MGWTSSITVPSSVGMMLFVCRRPNYPQTSSYQQSYLISIAFVLVTFMSSLVYCQTSSIHAVTFSFYFTLSCTQKHAITSFPVAVLKSFRCLICSKMPFSSGILIFSRIPVIMPLHWGRFLVVHQYSKFSMHPQDFLLWEIYDDFQRSQHISKPTTVKFGLREQTCN